MSSNSYKYAKSYILWVKLKDSVIENMNLLYMFLYYIFWLILCDFIFGLIPSMFLPLDISPTLVYNRCNTMTPSGKCKTRSIVIWASTMNNPVGNNTVPLFLFDTCSVLYIKYTLLSMLYCNMYQCYISLLAFLFILGITIAHSSILF